MNGKREIWLLTTTNDRMPLGDKATVSVHESEMAARREMQADMDAVLALRGLLPSNVVYEPEAMYAQTNDAQYCWCIERKEV